MNILHVLSQKTATGSEFYAATLANNHLKEGHQVFIISDTLTAHTKAHYTSLPIAERNYPQRFRNILNIKEFVKKNNIHIVHAHSRAASWVCYFALLGSKIPLISTIHGRQHLHLSVKVFDMYGDVLLPVCHNLKEHLTNEVNIKVEKIQVMPNCLDFNDIQQKSNNDKTHDNKLILSIIGRTNDRKGEKTADFIENVFPQLLQDFPSLEIHLVGGQLEKLPPRGQNQWVILNQKYNNRLIAKGFVKQLNENITQSKLVIASGRVAIESLYLERPTIACGEAWCHGLVIEDNLQEVIASNFGDILSKEEKQNIDYQLIINEIKSVLENKTTVSSFKEVIGKHYNQSDLSQKMIQIYWAARMKKHHPKPIPALMYHKIPDNEIDSPNKIFVVKKNFEKHLRFFKKSGFQSITLADYQAFAQGEKSLDTFPAKPILLTFDDGYLDNLTNALPLMEKYGFKGVIFLLGDENITYNFWDADQGDHRDELMNRQQQRQLIAAGWEVGAHTLSHPHLTDCPTTQIIEELEKSKQNLEKSLNIKILSFAYPYGAYNEQIKKLTQSAGFLFGVATDSGGIHLEDDRFAIFRVNIFPHETASSLWKKTSSWYRKYYKLKRGK